LGTLIIAEIFHSIFRMQLGLRYFLRILIFSKIFHCILPVQLALGWGHAHRHFSTPLDGGRTMCVQQLCGLCNLANFGAKLHAMQPQPVEWVQGFFGVFPFNYEPLNASQVWLLPLFLLWLLLFSGYFPRIWPQVQMGESFSCVSVFVFFFFFF